MQLQQLRNQYLLIDDSTPTMFPGRMCQNVPPYYHHISLLQFIILHYNHITPQCTGGHL